MGAKPPTVKLVTSLGCEHKNTYSQRPSAWQRKTVQNNNGYRHTTKIFAKYSSPELSATYFPNGIPSQRRLSTHSVKETNTGT